MICFQSLYLLLFSGMPPQILLRFPSINLTRRRHPPHCNCLCLLNGAVVGGKSDSRLVSPVPCKRGNDHNNMSHDTYYWLYSRLKGASCGCWDDLGWGLEWNSEWIPSSWWRHKYRIHSSVPEKKKNLVSGLLQHNIKTDPNRPHYKLSAGH